VVPKDTVPIPASLPSPTFLGLSDGQVTAILQNNSDYNNFASQQRQQIVQAQIQIVSETAKDPLDPITIGNLYAGIETTCRALRDRASTSQQQNIAVLTDAQKAKLSVLNDALKLAPTITEAESGNLLGSVGSPPYSFVTASLVITSYLYPVGYSGVSGCTLSFPVNTIQVYQPAMAPTGSSQPGVSELTTPPVGTNEPVNQWFHRDDLYRSGGFQKLIKPQTKVQ
jgi:hypothetical protein